MTLVAVGTSTGGPRALLEVLKKIPGDIKAAFIIVQHMPPGFTGSLAKRLDSLCGITVKEAEDHETVKLGYAYIAPGDFHIKVQATKDEGLKIRLSQELPVRGHRPSVDVMMDSVAKTKYEKVIGVIMTGMGSDGSKGIVNIKKCNKAFIISQDEDSCIVYGMPKSAVATGVVDVVAPLKDIAEVIIKNVGVDL